MEYYDEVVEIKKKPDAKPKMENPTVVDDDADRTTTKRPASSLPRKSAQKTAAAIAERPGSSESDSSESDAVDHAKVPAEGFDYKQWESLNVSGEVKEMFQYIGR